MHFWVGRSDPSTNGTLPHDVYTYTVNDALTLPS